MSYGKLMTFAIGQWFTRNNGARLRRDQGRERQRDTSVDKCVIVAALPGDRYSVARVDRLEFDASGAPILNKSTIGRTIPVLAYGLSDRRTYTPIPTPRPAPPVVAPVAAPVAAPVVAHVDDVDTAATRALLVRLVDAAEALVLLWGGKPKPHDNGATHP